MAGTDFSHLTSDELIKGIKALNLPDYIRSKAYGIDVRETLAQMTEMLMQLAYNQGMNPQEAKEWVSQLNNKVDKGNVSVNDINKNIGKLDQTFMTDEFLQQMAGTTSINAVPADGSLTTPKYSDDSVTPEKTSFTERKNLFSGAFENASIAGGFSGVYTKNTGGKTAIIEVDSGVGYSISFDQISQNDLLRIYTSETYPTDLMNVDNFSNFDGRKVVENYQVPTGARYIMIYVASPSNGKTPINFQVEKSPVATKYETPNSVIIKLSEEMKIDGKLLNDKTVTVEKISFAEKGINLFDETYVKDFGMTGNVSDNNGTWEVRTGAVSAVQKVSAGGTYTISKSPDTDLFSVGALSGYPKQGGYIRYIVQEFTGETPSHTITLNENEDHIVVYVSSVNQGREPSWMQIEEGTEASPYESHNSIKLNFSGDTVVEGIKPGTLDADKTKFLGHNNNLFDGEFVAWVTSPALDNHVSRSPSNGLKQSAVLEIEGGKTYSINTIDETMYLQVSTYDENPIGIDAMEGNTLHALTYEDFSGSTTATITAPADATHMLVRLSDDGILPKHLTITQTDEAKKPYIVDTRLFENLEGRHKAKNIGYVTDNVAGNYEKSDTPEYLITDIQTSNPVDSLYSYWDALVDLAPEYVTKTLMWNEPKEGLPVYKYTLNPGTPTGKDGDKIGMPKILITGNVHGHERYSALMLINFFTDLIKNWQTNDKLNLLRWNVQFDIFPIYNPYGLKHLQRVNGNGVDLNSNMPNGWALRETLGDPYYSGPSALSEYENQQFDAYLDNLDYTYDFALDAHHNGYFTGDRISYTRSMNQDVNLILYGVANQMNGYVNKEYQSIFTTNNHRVQLIEHDAMGRMFSYFEYKKIPGAIFEIMHPAQALTDEMAINIAATSIGNIFLSVVRNLDMIKLVK